MRKPLGAICGTALTLLSFPAWAVYNGVEFTGVKPDEVTSGEISFGDAPATRLRTRDECISDEADDVNCQNGYLWFAYSEQSLAAGTKINVTLRDANGNTRTGTGTVTETGKVRVQVDPLRSARTTDSGPVPRVAVNGGYGEWTLPPGIGGLAIRFTPGVEGSEQFISLAPEDYEGESAGFTVYVPRSNESSDLLRAFMLRIDLEDYQADDFVTFGTGAESRGVAHQVENAPSGSTGLAIPGTVAIDTFVENDVQSWAVEVGSLGLGDPDDGISYGLGLSYRNTTQDITNTLAVPAFPGIAARTDEEVEDQVLSIPLTVTKGWNADGTARPNIFVRLAPGYYKSELSGTYQFACNLCPAADQAFEQRIEDDDDGFTWSGEAGLGLNLHLGDRFVVGLYGRYSYLDRIGIADNRESPLDEPVHLSEDSADGWSAGINFGLEFRQ